MAISPDQVWVVVAAFNEAAVIGSVIADLRTAGYPVVVVDDGSNDGTSPRAAEAGAVVIQHPINLGQGAGLQTGIEYALKQGADFIVTFDGDGQHRVGDIPQLLETLTTNHADFALGNRFSGATVDMPADRRLLVKAATLLTRLTTGLDVSDSHNGLRAMTRRGAQAIRLRQNRMAHASEILHQIAASELPYVEAPVTIEYSSYSLAKGQRLSDSLAIMIDLFARWLHR